jgi:hypothetical protein
MNEKITTTKAIELYITLVKRKTWLISASLGTLPSSSWRATAILALRRDFFAPPALLMS